MKEGRKEENEGRGGRKDGRKDEPAMRALKYGRSFLLSLYKEGRKGIKEGRILRKEGRKDIKERY
jgi:hypothetical protein